MTSCRAGFGISRSGGRGHGMALPLARSCRAAGLALVLDLSGAVFGKQFKRAHRSGAHWVAVIGEAEEGVVMLREMGGEGGADGGVLREGEKRIAIGDCLAQLLTVRQERAELGVASPAATLPAKRR
jgi:histidyl-tRNA synthetase